MYWYVQSMEWVALTVDQCIVKVIHRLDTCPNSLLFLIGMQQSRDCAINFWIVAQNPNPMFVDLQQSLINNLIAYTCT